MHPDLIQKITREVARSHPQMSGVRPTVKLQSDRGEAEEYLLTYRTTTTLPGGRSMNIIVRVVADDRGRILKVSTSR